MYTLKGKGLMNVGVLLASITSFCHKAGHMVQHLIKGAIVLTAASESTAQQVFSPFNWKLMGLPVLEPSYLEPMLA